MLLMLILATTTMYPGLGDRGVVKPRTIEVAPRVEMVRDLGPILELTVRCNGGAAIISYSKVERLYCRPNGGCDRDLISTISRACRAS